MICEVQPELLPLLAQLQNDHGITVIAKGAPLPAFDLHCPLLSLPLAFGSQPATIPAAIPYLAAPAELLEQWRDRLPPGGPRVGFVWSGQPSHKNDANGRFRSSVSPGCSRIHLCAVSVWQSGMRDADQDVLKGLPNLIHLGDSFRDFADTAAVIASLDAVVSVDTAVAHLAGCDGQAGRYSAALCGRFPLAAGPR